MDQTTSPIWYEVELIGPTTRLIIRAASPEVYAQCVLSHFPGRSIGFHRNTATLELFDANPDRLSDLLELMRTSIHATNGQPLEIWTLDHHMQGGSRTAMGQLLYDAKYKGDSGAGERLAKEFADRLRWHPGISSSDLVVPVPGWLDGYESLPLTLARELAASTDVAFSPSAVRKNRFTPRIKDVPIADRKQCLHAAFQSDTDLSGMRVVLVDDIVETGSTLQAVASALEQAGATCVIGLAATRAKPSFTPL